MVCVHKNSVHYFIFKLTNEDKLTIAQLTNRIHLQNMIHKIPLANIHSHLQQMRHNIQYIKAHKISQTLNQYYSIFVGLLHLDKNHNYAISFHRFCGKALMTSLC